MEAGPPPQKRPRTQPPPPTQWHNGVHHNSQPPTHSLPLPPPLNQSRSLPPISQPPHQYGQSPYRPDHPSPLPPLDDRRHHNERPYEPPELRRPNSGASHGYQPSPTGPNHSQSPYPNGPREPPPHNPMIKRDPSVDESQQYRRSPNSHPDQHVAHHLPHEGARGPYQQSPHSHPPTPSHFEPQHMPPQQQHRNNSYPPPSPMGAPSQYNAEPYQRSGHFQPAEPYPPPNYPQQQGTPRIDTKPRKAQRAAQACDSCRTLKAKCDEGRPKCNSCVEKNQECNYRDPPPKQQDKSTTELADTLTRLDNILRDVPWAALTALARMPDDVQYQAGEIKQLRHKVEHMEGRMEQILSTGRQDAGEPPKHEQQFKPEDSVYTSLYQAPTLQASVQQTSARRVSAHQAPPREADTPTTTEHRHTHVSTKPLAESAESGSQSPEMEFDHQQENVSEEDGVVPPRQEPTIPLDHTTEAANLLQKVGVASLVSEIIGTKRAIKSVRYAAEQEKKRGQLQFFGRGESVDYVPGYDPDIGSDHQSEGTPGENHSEHSSPAGDYERGGILSPPTFAQEQPNIGEHAMDRKFDFSEETVKTLIQSYKDNINNMHPLFTYEHIDKMVFHFLKTHTRSRQTPTSNPVAAFIGSTNSWDMESPGNKRKRSPAGEPHDIPKSFGQPRFDSRPVDRSVNTGLVLLMLALGKVCLHTKKIPDVTNMYTPENARTNSPLVRNGYPSSPIQNSPSFPATVDLNYRSRRQSTEGNLKHVDLSKTTNIDWIPGLDYFAYATDIIGNQLGGNRFQHVHLGLLAGLYHGQLGRVVDSHAYIFQASRILQELMKKKLERFKKIADVLGYVHPRDNSMLFAFWTTLQLESDIIAEMPLEQSGILRHEENIPHPNLSSAEEDDHMPRIIVESYSAQLYLRKHLNRIHSTLYRPPEGLISPENQKLAERSIKALEESIAITGLDSYGHPNGKWAGTMLWNGDLGERSADILHARLRAKWYGAGVITFRPYILAILEASTRIQQQQQQEREGHRGRRVNPPGHFNNLGVPIVKDNAEGPQDIEPKAREYVRKGLLALIHSTSAFHDVADPGSQRLIVTNIWGTAHAQWGNLVTLQAAYNDRCLKPLVLEVITQAELSLLLEKTIAFLTFNGTRTSALSTDARILRQMGRKQGLLPGSAKQTPQDRYDPPQQYNSSFNSVSSAEGREVAMGGTGVYHS